MKKVRVITSSQWSHEYLFELDDSIDTSKYYEVTGEIMKQLDKATPINSTQLGYQSIFSAKEEQE